MSHLYNEIEPNAAAWMKNLMDAGEIPQGKIDVRPIQQITGTDLAGLRQFHTFVGIGGWPLALRLAGWPEDREVWTGSCPCQPFSSAGKGGGVADARHLWPEFFRLIKECRPATVFGEQVGSKAGIGWLDGVQADLEGEGYTCGAVIVGAHSVGAPHIRQRIYWVATLERLGDSDGAQDHAKRRPDESGRNAVERVIETLPERQASHDGLGRSGEAGRLQHAAGDGRDERGAEPGGRGVESRCAVGGVADGPDARRDDAGQHDGRRSLEAARPEQRSGGVGEVDGLADDDEGQQERGQGRGEQDGIAVPVGSGPWSDYRIIPCTDGKARRTGARVFPLAHGIPRRMEQDGPWRKGLARGASRARIGMLKGSGNSIVPGLAAEFVRAFMDTCPPLAADGKQEKI